MTKIIITADDFGRSHERNLAIDYAYKEGLISSIGLLINSKYTSEAIDLARKGGYTAHLHCHLNIASGAISGYSTPLSDTLKASKAFCINGDFLDSRKTNFSNTFNPNNWRAVYDEIEKQYLRFIELTESVGNAKHIDFHLWQNYRFPVAKALNEFINSYDIASFRRNGIQHAKKYGLKYKIMRDASNLFYSKGSCKMISSSGIDYYLRNGLKKEGNNYDIFELFVHPDLTDGIIIDQTESKYTNKRFSLKTHIAMLEEKTPFEMVSWEN